jgi:hypothetical protein
MFDEFALDNAKQRTRNKQRVGGGESWRRRRKCGTNGTTRRRRRSITEKVGSGVMRKKKEVVGVF